MVIIVQVFFLNDKIDEIMYLKIFKIAWCLQCSYILGKICFIKNKLLLFPKSVWHEFL